METDKTGDHFVFLELLGKLKHLKRTGWVLKGVQEPETVASHMYRMAMMTFMLGEEDSLDKNRCLKMALVHDLGESIIGDITPHCRVTPEEKQVKEMEAMTQISKLLGHSGDEVLNLFVEYEEQKTRESKFVKELDLFDMSFQAFEYEKRDSNCGELEEFISSTREKFSHPLILKLINKMYESRDQLKSQNVNISNPNSMADC